MSHPKTLISFCESPLTNCNPNLMPFHVGYSGPASVSAFMRVENYKDYIQEDNATKPAGSPTNDMKTSTNNSLSIADSQLKKTLSESSLTEVESQANSESTIIGESQTSGQDSIPDVAPELEDADKRFVSTFRGRLIHGLTIELPSGYSGLVLRADDKNSVLQESKTERLDSKTNNRPKANSSKSNGKAKAAVTEPATRSRGRLTRSAVKPTVITVDNEGGDAKEENDHQSSNITVDVPMDGVQNEDIPDRSEVRKLVPQAQFSSFTLWHADRPVDKGNDDYYRMLTEWITLSHEINQTDHL